MDPPLDITRAPVPPMGTAQWQVNNPLWLASCLLNLQLVGSGFSSELHPPEVTDGLGHVLIAIGSVRQLYNPDAVLPVKVYLQVTGCILQAMYSHTTPITSIQHLLTCSRRQPV